MCHYLTSSNSASYTVPPWVSRTISSASNFAQYNTNAIVSFVASNKWYSPGETIVNSPIDNIVLSTKLYSFQTEITNSPDSI